MARKVIRQSGMFWGGGERREKRGGGRGRKSKDDSFLWFLLPGLFVLKHELVPLIQESSYRRTDTCVSAAAAPPPPARRDSSRDLFVEADFDT